MPMALMLQIRPLSNATVQPSLARAAHAAILNIIREANPDLAQQVHDEVGAKPLTVSNVLGMHAQGNQATVQTSKDYGLRISLLTPALEQLAQAWQPEQLGLLNLDGSSWRVEAILRQEHEHPWVGLRSYSELIAPSMAQDSIAHRWTFQFHSPVTFRQRGLNQPMPTPDLVFGSLLDKWNAVAPLTFPDEVKRFASECMATSYFELRSQREPTKNQAIQIGAVGHCTYTATSRDRYWCSCIDTLARFAFWSGVGAGTTRGLGRARLVER